MRLHKLNIYFCNKSLNERKNSSTGMLLYAEDVHFSYLNRMQGIGVKEVPRQVAERFLSSSLTEVVWLSVIFWTRTCLRFITLDSARPFRINSIFLGSKIATHGKFTGNT